MASKPVIQQAQLTDEIGLVAQEISAKLDEANARLAALDAK